MTETRAIFTKDTKWFRENRLDKLTIIFFRKNIYIYLIQLSQSNHFIEEFHFVLAQRDPVFDFIKKNSTNKAEQRLFQVEQRTLYETRVENVFRHGKIKRVTFKEKNYISFIKRDIDARSALTVRDGLGRNRVVSEFDYWWKIFDEFRGRRRDRVRLGREGREGRRGEDIRGRGDVEGGKAALAA